ncbi:hypothetical protein BKA70DRAFT_1048495, partial [Coprinopsis sp. MPI-PUGE-AT-0042]
WGRLRRMGWGDTMLASEVVDATGDDRRDATWVRYELWVDKYAHQRNRDPKFQLRTFYGQLQAIYLITIPPSDVHPYLNAGTTTEIALGSITPAEITEDHPHGLDIHYYKTTRKTDIVDIASIYCLVARAKWKGKSAIFDRSGTLGRAI